ncbi:MAG: HAMP domain-containing histidine kinase, partial [Flammeovirgaceae bacterium]|nr:HAMP domain-containing histidine kinase [Flammeovirgaceae bacterium]
DLAASKRYIDSANIWNGNTRNRVMAKTYLLLADWHEKNKQYDKAHAYLKRGGLIKDSLDTRIKQIEVMESQSRVEWARQQQQLDLLKSKEALQEKDIRIRNLVAGSALAGFAVAVILAFLFYRNYKRKRHDNQLLQEKNEEIECMLEEIRSFNDALKEQNEKIEQLNSSLEEDVKQRTEELGKTNRELNTFLYHASHDIRRPIATILGLDQVIRLSVKDSESLLIFDKVSETALSMDSMLFKLQMVHELSNTPAEFSALNLSYIIQETANRFDQQFKQYHVDYIQIQSEAITVQSDARFLRMIFQNLIENSILFRKTGPEKSWIKIALIRSEDKVIVTIEDNGRGIEQEHLSKVFDLYFRASELSNGNGLGLYLVKKAIDRLKGSVKIQSEYGSGTRFEIIL